MGGHPVSGYIALGCSGSTNDAGNKGPASVSLELFYLYRQHLDAWHLLIEKLHHVGKFIRNAVCDEKEAHSGRA